MIFAICRDRATDVWRTTRHRGIVMMHSGINSNAAWRRGLMVVAIIAAATVANGSSQQAPRAPKNVRIVVADRAVAPPTGGGTLSFTVRTGHPRLHFTPETLPTWRSWLAGPLRTQWQM